MRPCTVFLDQKLTEDSNQMKPEVRLMKRLIIAPFLLLVLLANASISMAQSKALAQRVQSIMDRPEFRHAIFGIEFYSLDKRKLIYSVNADKLFTPGSTTT